jgi:hypothetical protein
LASISAIKSFEKLGKVFFITSSIIGIDCFY